MRNHSRFAGHQGSLGLRGDVVVGTVLGQHSASVRPSVQVVEILGKLAT